MEKRSKLVIVGLAIIVVAFFYLVYMASRGIGASKAAGDRSPETSAVTNRG